MMRSVHAAVSLLLLGSGACAAGTDAGNSTFGSFSAGNTAGNTAGASSTSGGGSSGGGTAGGSGTAGGGTGASSGGDTSSGGSSGGGPAECGNGVIEGAETCEGMDFGGKTCQDFGFSSGDLLCSGSCQALTDGCFTCGDGTKQVVEACDGQDFGGDTCMTLGFASGTLQCAVDCTAIGTSGCQPLSSCGNGVKDAGEQCDGAQLGGATCATQGFDSGTLSCKADCTFDTSQCMTDPTCAGQGEVCIFDQNDPQSNCCPPGVKGNVLGICDLIVCL